jgi:hypothetical protein
MHGEKYHSNQDCWGLRDRTKFNSDETGMQGLRSGSFGRTNVGVKGWGTKMLFGNKMIAVKFH